MMLTSLLANIQRISPKNIILKPRLAFFVSRFSKMDGRRYYWTLFFQEVPAAGRRLQAGPGKGHYIATRPDGITFLIVLE